MTHSDPIADRYHDFVAGMKSGDVEMLVSLLADDVVFMPPADPTLHGRGEVKNWYEEYFEYFAVLQLDETERKVHVSADFVVEHVAFSVQLEPKKAGTRIYDEARILSIWRRGSDGRWVMWHSMWNSVKPIGAGTNRFLVRFMQDRGES